MTKLKNKFDLLTSLLLNKLLVIIIIVKKTSIILLYSLISLMNKFNF